MIKLEITIDTGTPGPMDHETGRGCTGMEEVVSFWLACHVFQAESEPSLLTVAPPFTFQSRVAPASTP
ncbi:hypothetical protein ACHAWO_012145 [Cyclotella atomus]|uniref:Uncharacterized protein n=1 Tax=Cyclotella atomus TaxID=382360 RepID=A0ABD3NV83_9STRA